MIFNIYTFIQFWSVWWQLEATFFSLFVGRICSLTPCCYKKFPFKSSILFALILISIFCAFLSFAFVYCCLFLAPKKALKKEFWNRKGLVRRLQITVGFLVVTPFHCCFKAEAWWASLTPGQGWVLLWTAVSIQGSFETKHLLTCQLLFLFICAYCIHQGTVKGTVMQRAAWRLLETESDVLRTAIKAYFGY